jgi:uncharacterized protein YoxC
MVEIEYGNQIRQLILDKDDELIENTLSQWELYTNELERDIQDKVAVIGMLEGQVMELGGALNSMVNEIEESSYSKNIRKRGQRII